jgi:hypothetical protein
MTKETRMTKPKRSEAFFFHHLSFVINSAFGVRASSFSSAAIARQQQIITEPSLRKRVFHAQFG